MEYFVSLLAATGLLVWIGIGIIFLFSVGLFTQDKYGWATIVWVTLVGSFVYFVVYPANPFDLTFQEGAFYVLTYLAVGIVVAIIRWIVIYFLHTRQIAKVRAMFESKRTDTGEFTIHDRVLFANLWNEAYRADTFHIDGYPYFPNYATESFASDNALTERLELHAAKNKARITSWIVAWPIVVTNSLVEDLFLKLSKHLVRLIDLLVGGIFRARVNKVMKGL